MPLHATIDFTDWRNESLTFSTKFAMLFFVFISASGRKIASATGVPRVGHGGSFAQACRIRIAR